MKGIKLIIASSNKGKIREFQKILPNFECIPQSDFDVFDVDETGRNFKENAVLKAKNAFIKTNLPSIGDDSGLIVPEINGEPGLYSARYAGKNAKEVLDWVKTVAKKRKLESTYAYFFCCIVAIGINDKEDFIICDGKVDGEVKIFERGDKGFGYDPMFYPKGYSESFAELSSLIKNKISHRGIALRNLTIKLNST